ncbi:ribonuclease H-like domain-containing protein [Paenibacillus piri]|uniref:YprB ribonuclease H-like domain-containing protein n=1 Tax=Paenibacillus piri TaxID=2547395 RepID=A0A4R5KWM2_9BACL|nr:ribonuclease H-like domain-containing protein [Paenibacillus piri]TDF99578.1 hypothetical protein E1757_07000 [Paenibacillus piri]
MSGLRERLLRHKKPAGGGPEPGAEPAAAAREDSAAAAPAADAEWAQLGAHMEQGEHGAFVMRRRVYDSAARHGRYALGELIGQSDQLHALLAPPAAKKGAAAGRGSAAEPGRGMGGRQSDGRLPHDRLLYLDTETTGLGVGAGNVPFMIGIGFYERGQLVVEQMFIRHPGEELAMLHYLQRKLEEHPVLVSYNGKSFDWPIIKNRYILNRMPSEPEIDGHLDFLYPSRSLWKHTLPSCRLGKVEEERLHVVREHDVPGSLAPALYFQYLAERDVSIVQGIFEHNELDILSLAGLSIHFAGTLNGQSRIEEMELEELYRLGLWLDKLDRGELAARALELLEQRLAGGMESEAAAGYMLPLAQVYKQQRRFADACRLWTLYTERKGERSVVSLEPFIELSMHYEHREKQLGRALHYAEWALQHARQRQSLRRSYGLDGVRRHGGHVEAAADETKARQHEEIAALEKRAERLRRKLQQSDSAQAANRARSTAAGRRSSAATGKKRAKPDVQYVMDQLI